MIPASVNISDKTQASNKDDLSDTKERLNTIQSHISYKDVLSKKVFLLTAISGFAAYFEYSYMEPVLALRVMEFDVSPFFLGIFF